MIWIVPIVSIEILVCYYSLYYYFQLTVQHNATYAKLYVLPESYELTNKAPDDLQFRQTPPRQPLSLPSKMSIGGILPSAAT